VLGVDLNADLTANKPAAPATATLEVSVTDAQKLAVAADLGTLSLALRKTGSAEVSSVGIMRTSNFAVGGNGGGGRSAAAPSGAPRSPFGSGLIVIVEGGSRHGKPAPAPAPAAPATPAAPAAAAPNASANLASAFSAGV
jgi:pilus assembly protein CpaB